MCCRSLLVARLDRACSGDVHRRVDESGIRSLLRNSVASGPRGRLRLRHVRAAANCCRYRFGSFAGAQGARPAEEIVQKFPSLELSDVYQVIGYYLKYRTELGEYLKKRELEEGTLLAHHSEWSPAGLRERLMARRKTR